MRFLNRLFGTIAALCALAVCVVAPASAAPPEGGWFDFTGITRSFSSGATLCVGTKPACYSSIQTAVDAANEGDTIDIASGLFVGGLVLFALATLPVEIGASHRALGLLRQTGLADATEFREIRRVLRAAALTYVVGILDRLGFFLVLLFVAEAARRVAT